MRKNNVKSCWEKSLCHQRAITLTTYHWHLEFTTHNHFHQHQFSLYPAASASVPPMTQPRLRVSQQPSIYPTSLSCTPFPSTVLSLHASPINTPCSNPEPFRSICPSYVCSLPVNRHATFLYSLSLPYSNPFHIAENAVDLTPTISYLSIPPVAFPLSTNLIRNHYLHRQLFQLSTNLINGTFPIHFRNYHQSPAFPPIPPTNVSIATGSIVTFPFPPALHAALDVYS